VKEKMEIRQQETIQILSGPTGKRFKTPVTAQLPGGMESIPKDIYNYIVEGLSWRMPRLITFALQSPAVINMAKYFRRHLSGSFGSIYNYVHGVHRFCGWIGKTPDQLISECKDVDGDPNPKMLARHAALVEDFIGDLTAERLAPATIKNYVKAVKTLYASNGLKLELPQRMTCRVVNEDRAPRPEELQRLIDIGDLREKVIVSCLALGGFREGTLCKLCYYHIRDDLERGIVPVHVHVEAEITKGKYHDYDTFLGQEAVDYIKAYLDLRRRGTPRSYNPPEEIQDDSPLIRNERLRVVKPIKPHQLYDIVHNLYIKAGLLRRSMGRFYTLRVHSIRKYFRTQLAALGVPSDYIEYMMGHTISTYHDIKMKGVEFLRNVYAASGLSIRPKVKMTQIEMLKEIIRALGGDPEKAMLEQAFSRPHRTIAGPAEVEDGNLKALQTLLKELMRKELLESSKAQQMV
jgi:hypothetical protein